MNYKTIHERVKPTAPLLKCLFGRELRCSTPTAKIAVVTTAVSAHESWFCSRPKQFRDGSTNMGKMNSVKCTGARGALSIDRAAATSERLAALLERQAQPADSPKIQTGQTEHLTELTAGRKEPVLNDRPQKRVFYGLSAGCFLPLLLVSGDTGGDALSHLFEQYCDWVNNLHPYVFQFLVRSTLVLGLSSLFCWLAFRRGNRSALLQAFIFLNSAFLALAIPVEHWNLSHRVVKAWVVAICVFLTATLPAVLPLFVAPELGNQQRIRRITFGVLLVLFIGTLIRALSSWKS